MAYTVEYAVSRMPGDSCPYGIVIDGVLFKLDVQPPVAVSQGWGNMLWLYN